MKPPTFDPQEFDLEEHYRRVAGGYKLNTRMSIQSDLLKGMEIEHEYIKVTKDGTVTCELDYLWDGITMFPDIKTGLRASLFHDALYQLIEEGLLKPMWRDPADHLLAAIAKADGMNPILAQGFYYATHWFGKYAIKAVRG